MTSETNNEKIRMLTLLAVITAVVADALQRWSTACEATGRTLPDAAWRMTAFGGWWAAASLLSRRAKTPQKRRNPRDQAKG